MYRDTVTWKLPNPEDPFSLLICGEGAWYLPESDVSFPFDGSVCVSDIYKDQQSYSENGDFLPREYFNKESSVVSLWGPPAR